MFLREIRRVRKRKSLFFFFSRKLPVPVLTFRKADAINSIITMAMSDAKKASKKSPDFTEGESVVIINAVGERYGLINSSTHTAQANKKRRRAWKEVAEEVNACCGFGRSVESIQKRWKDMKSKVKNKPRLGRQTGGGPPEPPVPFEEAILAVIKGSSTLDGLVAADLGDSYGHCSMDTEAPNSVGCEEVQEETSGVDGDLTVIYNYNIPCTQNVVTLEKPECNVYSAVDAGVTSGAEAKATKGAPALAISATASRSVCLSSVDTQSQNPQCDAMDSDEMNSQRVLKKKSSQRQRSSSKDSSSAADVAWIKYLQSATKKNKLKCAVLKKKDAKLKLELQLLKSKLPS